MYNWVQKVCWICIICAFHTIFIFCNSDRSDLYIMVSLLFLLYKVYLQLKSPESYTYTASIIQYNLCFWHFFLCYTETWRLMNYFPYSTNDHKCEPAFCSRVIIIKTLSFFSSAKSSSFNLSYPPACVLFHYSWQIVGWNNKRICAVMFNIQFEEQPSKSITLTHVSQWYYCTFLCMTRF